MLVKRTKYEAERERADRLHQELHDAQASLRGWRTTAEDRLAALRTICDLAHGTEGPLELRVDMIRDVLREVGVR